MSRRRSCPAATARLLSVAAFVLVGCVDSVESLPTQDSAPAVPMSVTTTTIGSVGTTTVPALNHIATWVDDPGPFLSPVTDDDLWIVPGAGGPDSATRGFLVNLGGCLGLIGQPGAPPLPLVLGDQPSQGSVEITDGGLTVEMNGNPVPLGTYIEIGGADQRLAEIPVEVPPGCPLDDDGWYFSGSPAKASRLRAYDPARDGVYTPLDQ